MLNCRRTIGVFAVTVTAAISAISCGSDKKDDKKGRALNIPAIKPPVDAVTPAGFGANSQALRLLNVDCDESGSAIERLKARLFCPGPGDFRHRLGKVDERMAELSKRSEDNAPTCIDNKSKLWDVPMPNGENFPMHFSCFERMGETELKVFFGEDDESFYMAELQNPGGDTFVSTGDLPNMAVLAKVNKAGNMVNVWQVFVDEDQTSNWLKLSADESKGTIELAAMGSSVGFGVGCGINMRSDGELVFVDGIVSDSGLVGGCTGTAGDVDVLFDGACLDATTLEEVSDSECVDAEISQFTFDRHTHADVAVWDEDGTAGKIVRGLGLPSDLTDFKESKLADEEEDK